MSFLQYIPGVVSAVSGILGQRRASSAANEAKQRQQAQAGKLGSYQNAFDSDARRAQSGVQQFDPQYRASVMGAANYLRRDPGSDQRDAGDLARATGGATIDAERSRANLTAELARRGIGNSSVAAGGLAGIEGVLAAQRAGARSDIAQQRSEERRRNTLALPQLLGQATNDFQGDARAAQSGGVGISQLLLGNARGDTQQAMFQQQDANGQLSALLAQLGQLLPGLGQKKEKAGPGF